MKPDDYRRLVASGMTPDQIALVMEMFDAKDEERKAGQRARWRKSQENKRNAHVSKRELTTANVPRGGDARVEDKTSNSEIEPLKKTNTNTRDLDAFKSALSGVCDAERIDAFVKHRRMKRGAMTAHAAKLFLADAQACGLSVPDAVDTCISRNWITVKPEFLAGRNQPRAGPTVVPIKDTPANAARRRLDDIQQRRLNGSGTAVDDHQPATGVLSLDYRRAGG